MELKFSSDLDSAKRLDEIMNSYSGRDRGFAPVQRLQLHKMDHLLFAHANTTHHSTRTLLSDELQMTILS